MKPFDFFKKTDSEPSSIASESPSPVSASNSPERLPVPLVSSEQQPLPEVTRQEQTPLPEQQSQGQAVASTATALSEPTASAPLAVAVPKSSLRKNIETILSDGLMHVYQTMSLKDQERFRVTGEETATAIEMLVTSLKATGKQLVQLLRAWLLLIPHVNKFFMEQETKIKTDHLLVLQEQKRKEQRANKFSS